jgi:hypothetical protein
MDKSSLIKLCTPVAPIYLPIKWLMRQPLRFLSQSVPVNLKFVASRDINRMSSVGLRTFGAFGRMHY